MRSLSNECCFSPCTRRLKPLFLPSFPKVCGLLKLNNQQRSFLNGCVGFSRFVYNSRLEVLAAINLTNVPLDKIRMVRQRVAPPKLKRLALV